MIGNIKKQHNIWTKVGHSVLHEIAVPISEHQPEEYKIVIQLHQLPDKFLTELV